MGFPPSPIDGEVYEKNSTSYYVYASATNAWTKTADPNLLAKNIKNSVTILGVLGNYIGNVGLGDLYVCSLDMPPAYYNYGTPPILQSTTYACQVGNYIYCPVDIRIWNGNQFEDVTIIIIDTTSSSFPTRSLKNSFPSSSTIDSLYLDSGKIYFNYHDPYNQYYWYFDTSTNTWDANYHAGSHTSGTHLNSAFTLNGFKYEPAAAIGSDPVSGVYYLANPLCKITIA